MKTQFVRLLVSLATAFSLFCILSITFHSSPGAKGQMVPASGTIPPPITYTWTTWGAQQYAVASAGDDFWIGAS